LPQATTLKARCKLRLLVDFAIRFTQSMFIAWIKPRRAVANHLRTDVRPFKQYSSIQTVVTRNTRILNQHRLVVNKIREMFLRDVTKCLFHLRRVDAEQPDANRAIEIEDRDHVAAVDFDHFSKQRGRIDVTGSDKPKKYKRHKMP